MRTDKLTAAIKERALALGFSLCGACPAVTPAGAARLEEWLVRGYGGEMHYLQDRRAAYADPGRVLEGARSIVMLAMPYRTVEPAAVEAGQGRVSRYAWGAADYHDVMRERLHALADFVRELAPGAATRGVVDTAPLLEREFAQMAGLGWVGKNTLVLNRTAGSFFFLGAVLTDLELAYDAPHEADHCGTCTACLDACPTAAFPQAYVLDASRCISYLTIELRAGMPAEMRARVGEWVFGCDVCQDVCPWNTHQATSCGDAAFEPAAGMNPLELASLFELTEEDFRRRFRHTPLWRPHRRGVLRNAAIVLGNQRAAGAISALEKGLNDDESVVRGASAWALGQVGGEAATRALVARLADECDNNVQAEISKALASGGIAVASFPPSVKN